MNKLYAILLAAVGGFGAIHCCAADRVAANLANDTKNPANSFAVVELFGSEGCSSCPPADEVLSNLLKDAETSGLAIYPIAYHVDYWDRLGWRDPFSSAQATARQQAYAHALQRDNLYTPQMIINGQVEFVGSDKKRADAEIKTALKETHNVDLTMTITESTQNNIRVDFKISQAQPDAVLHVVAVERGLAIEVLRGENAGRTLRHENVVRSDIEIGLKGQESGVVTIPLPTGADKSHVSVIGFVQESASMKIIAAAKGELPIDGKAKR